MQLTARFILVFMDYAVIPLKNNFTYLILNDEGQINCKPDSKLPCRESGAYILDTRVLNQYEWNLKGFSLLHTDYIGSRSVIQYFSKFEHHKQSLLLIRTLSLIDGGFVDELELINDDIQKHDFTVELNLGSDFIDMFEVRGHTPAVEIRGVHQHHSPNQYDAHYVAADGVKTSVELLLEGFKFHEQLTIDTRKRKKLSVTAKFTCDYDIGIAPLDVKDNWLSNSKITDVSNIYRQAELDLHDLLLATKDGLTIAAGIPWFVTPFGRDGIITSWFLLNNHPPLAEGTLRFLAKHQGKKTDDFRDEQPGKILHEQRYSELSRLGKLPFNTYYGTADATPLFIQLLNDYVVKTGNVALVSELKENWIAALNWMENYQNSQGLIVFSGNTQGLVVQSWKDSADSLSYKDGRLGSGALAVAEVQGYAYAAYQAASSFYLLLKNPEKTAFYKAKAEKLKQVFEQLYWMPEHNNYAIAVDEHNHQLDINSSDSGHLLWTGIVSDNKVDALVERLFEPDLWSGWGLRTLSTQEVRYNPISYHNGSVWPHDTAIFAAGLKRYGKQAQFNIVRDALIGVASNQKDKRLPELFSGYIKNERPILPYIEACRPQAWAAAALVYLMNDGE